MIFLVLIKKYVKNKKHFMLKKNIFLFFFGNEQMNFKIYNLFLDI